MHKTFVFTLLINIKTLFTLPVLCINDFFFQIYSMMLMSQYSKNIRTPFCFKAWAYFAMRFPTLSCSSFIMLEIATASENPAEKK